jgi:hypothetical protein
VLFSVARIFHQTLQKVARHGELPGGAPLAS